VSGNNHVNTTGNYGEQGQADPNNVPGSRDGALGWYDHTTKELWLFGGFGFDGNGSAGTHSNVYM